jgi:hypothetical protein
VTEARGLYRHGPRVERDPALRVRVIDGFSVEGLSERELGGRKPRTALRLLALADGRPVTADVLWLDERLATRPPSSRRS